MGKKIFNQLEEQINGYTNVNPDCKIVYQLFDPDMSDTLIIAIVTPYIENSLCRGTCLICVLRNL